MGMRTRVGVCVEELDHTEPRVTWFADFVSNGVGKWSILPTNCVTGRIIYLPTADDHLLSLYPPFNNVTITHFSKFGSDL